MKTFLENLSLNCALGEAHVANGVAGDFREAQQPQH